MGHNVELVLGLSVVAVFILLIGAGMATGVIDWDFYRFRLEVLREVISSDVRKRVRRTEEGIVIAPPRDGVMECQICLGKIKRGMDYARCECGKVFHPTCLRRTGYCPYCQRPFVEEGVHEAKELKRSTRPMCPVCGRELERGARECVCGAIFVTGDGEFECPTCGARLLEGEERCPICDERFERYEPLFCPRCGAIIPAGRDRCECGLPVDRICPVCGALLGKRDLVCDRCGTEFKFVEEHDDD